MVCIHHEAGAMSGAQRNILGYSNGVIGSGKCVLVNTLAATHHMLIVNTRTQRLFFSLRGLSNLSDRQSS
jgi:hypothetical protein